MKRIIWTPKKAKPVAGLLVNLAPEFVLGACDVHAAPVGNSTTVVRPVTRQEKHTTKVALSPTKMIEITTTTSPAAASRTTTRATQ